MFWLSFNLYAQGTDEAKKADGVSEDSKAKSQAEEPAKKKKKSTKVIHKTVTVEWYQTELGETPLKKKNAGYYFRKDPSLF
jgi:hypothetical protein